MFRNVGHQSPSDAASRARITVTPIEPQQKPKNLQICPGVVPQCFMQPVANRVVDSIYIIRFWCEGAVCGQLLLIKAVGLSNKTALMIH